MLRALAASMVLPTFRCRACGPVVQAERGCSRHGYGTPKPPLPVEVQLPSGESRFLPDCPNNLITPRIASTLRSFSHFQAGRFVYGPNLADWPDAELRRMEILEDELARQQAELRKGDGDGCD